MDFYFQVVAAVFQTEKETGRAVQRFCEIIGSQLKIRMLKPVFGELKWLLNPKSECGCRGVARAWLYSYINEYLFLDHIRHYAFGHIITLASAIKT